MPVLLSGWRRGWSCTLPTWPCCVGGGAQGAPVVGYYTVLRPKLIGTIQLRVWSFNSFNVKWLHAWITEPFQWQIQPWRQHSAVVTKGSILAHLNIERRHGLFRTVESMWKQNISPLLCIRFIFWFFVLSWLKKAAIWCARVIRDTAMHCCTTEMFPF